MAPPLYLVQRARARLAELTARHAGHSTHGEQAPLPLAAPVSPVLQALRAIDPDRLTPREALDQIYRLKGLLET